jgi:putative hydrolase of the HAD superfamily
MKAHAEPSVHDEDGSLLADNPMQTALPQCRPRGLLLDFGAVISVSVFERHRETERILGLPSGTLSWLGPIDPTTDQLWASMQNDEITEREYWGRRASELGELVGEPGWDVLTMLHRVRQSDPNEVVRPQVHRMIRVAKARGIRVGILSNELELFYGKDFLSRMDVLAYMSVVVDATHTGILKPDPRAYVKAIEGLGLPAQDVLFVDDQFRNIAGAVKVGLQTQYFDLRDIAGNLAAIAARLHLPL